MLLFQDLAVVPLLILVPALNAPAEELGRDVLIALAKAAVVLAVLTLVGPRVMRAWFGVIARRRSTELFVLNVLLITLLLAFLTGLAGLSLALGRVPRRHADRGDRVPLSRWRRTSSRSATCCSGCSSSRSA